MAPLTVENSNAPTEPYSALLGKFFRAVRRIAITRQGARTASEQQQQQQETLISLG
ncbi:unnamed protein product, partial [Nesidiocoris tenuis]